MTRDNQKFNSYYFHLFGLIDQRLAKQQKRQILPFGVRAIIHEYICKPIENNDTIINCIDILCQNDNEKNYHILMTYGHISCWDATCCIKPYNFL